MEAQMMEGDVGSDQWTDRQLPEGDEIFLDHLAHFVPDMSVAETAMADLGFQLSPLTPQSNAFGSDAPPVPVGLANRCAMLERGYLEILTPHGKAETPLADQLRAALERYVGVHLLAFSCADPSEQALRLAAEGLEPQPPVALQREIETEIGSGLLRFSVLRVKPGRMPEGRIQFLRHHTPDLLWQERWMTHANSARALTDVLLCVDDPEEVAARFSRFTGLAANGDPICVETARGRVTIIDVDTAARLLPYLPNTKCPFIAAYAVEAANVEQARRHVVAHGLHPYDRGRNADSFWVVGPPGLGGAILFHGLRP
ncbi:MAG: VOC family protein [Alphaproteobacteria bacterium]|nr:VOC family protein [Alphaproteobacteria bacterium]